MLTEATQLVWSRTEFGSLRHTVIFETSLEQDTPRLYCCKVKRREEVLQQYF